MHRCGTVAVPSGPAYMDFATLFGVCTTGLVSTLAAFIALAYLTLKD